MPLERHLIDEEIAMLVDGVGDDVDGLREHVARCGRCLDAYREAHAVLRGVSGASSDELEAVAESARKAGKRRLPGRSATAPRVLVPAALGVAIAAFALLWPRPDRVSPVGDPDRWRPPEGVVERIMEVSADGLVFPGGEAFAVGPGLRYRSDRTVDAPWQDSAWIRFLDDLRDAPDGSAEQAYWLSAALIVSGQDPAAALAVEEQVRRFPDDTRFQVLSAILAYRSSDLARAESLLQGVVEEDPTDSVARLNLGIVRRESGLPGAEEVLRTVVNRTDGPIRERALRELSPED